MRVSFQGEAGAYSEAAALEYFQDTQIETVPQVSFDDVFNSVLSGEADCGLIPIENSLAGSIHRNYDLLLRNTLVIVGEYYLRVRHCLISHHGVSIDEIKKVISHPQGLAQCEGFLSGMAGVSTEPVYDTAGSVKIIKAENEKSVAAIASKRAAEVYGMQILKEGIEDNKENYTRFLVVAKEAIKPTNAAKTSIVFTLRNEPGTLFKALSVFALRDIDLTKIESRPLVGKPWNYLFYIDFLGSESDEVIKKALAHLGEYSVMLRVLGSYNRHLWQT